MAMTPLDKMKLMGVLKKTPIKVYNNLYIDSRSKLSIYDFLNASIFLTLKFIEENQTEKVILNGLKAIEVTLLKMCELATDITEENYDSLVEVKEKASVYDNEEIKNTCENFIKIYQTSIRKYYEEETEEMDYSIEEDEEQEIESEEQNPEVNEENSEEEIEYVDVSDYLPELEATIEELKKQIAELNNEIRIKDKIILSNKKNLEEKNQSMVASRNEIKKLKKELNKLKNSYSLLNGMYKKVSADLKKRELAVANLEKKNTEVVAQNKKMNKTFEEQKDNRLEVKRHEEIVNAVLSLIANERLTILEICRTLRENGIKATMNEINFAIQELKTKYEIDDSILLNFEKSYLIVAKKPDNNRIFNININENVYEFMAFSDPHINYLTDYDIAVFDRIYDYMFANNITTAVNLGDFLAFKYPKEYNHEKRMLLNEKLLNRIIRLFPYEKSIKHLIMGGNHEEVILRLGIDPIEFLELNRTDFISLGHVSAFLKFNNSYIGLFHPDFRLKEKGGFKAGNWLINSFVENKCDKLNINREDIFMSLFGHFHIGDIGEKGIVLVPSLTRDRDFNGAWHIKLYFDSKGDIENAKLTRISLQKSAEAIETYELNKKLIK